MKFISGAFIVLLCITVSLIISFKSISNNIKITRPPVHQKLSIKSIVNSIGEIPLPGGYTRVIIQKGSFGEWLRNIQLRKDNTVYLYNGQPIEHQDLHYAVLDISTGNKDLQQCADAVMRLKAEYYFSKKEYDSIAFGEGRHVSSFQQYLDHIETPNEDKHALLMDFMKNVFINCGTYTVDAMTKPVALTDVQLGDVFVKAGSPGHAMIVVDVAKNNDGQKIYLLAQSYMPAQDMHIVINPVSSILNPWYEVMSYEKVITPGWVFEKNQLKRWK